MKILVTGANSLLGVNTVIGLLKNNYSVRGMVRRPDSIPVKNPNLEVVIGDITNKKDVFSAAEGCEVIVHLAANTNQNSRQYDDYKSVNVTGTRYTLEAAKYHNVRRTIIISSANTVGYGTSESPGKEEYPPCSPFTGSYYARSKQEAELYALKYSTEGMGDIIILNPSFMLGAYDTKPGSGSIIIRGYKKKIIFVPPGGKNFIHVKDVARAIGNAISRGRNKERYLLTNENMSYCAFYRMLNEVTDNKGLIIKIPAVILLIIGIIGSFLIFFGIKTALHYNNMRILCIKNYYGYAKAKKELNLRPSSVRTAIEDAVNWFKFSGKLPN